MLADIGEGEPNLILMSSGSEVELIVEAGEELAEMGATVRLVSFPSWELFAEQTAEYRQQVLKPSISARIAIEAGSPQGWEQWVGDRGVIIGLDRFGGSAPYGELYRHLGLTVECIIAEAQRLLGDIGVLEA